MATNYGHSFKDAELINEHSWGTGYFQGILNGLAIRWSCRGMKEPGTKGHSTGKYARELRDIQTVVRWIEHRTRRT